MIVLAIQKQKFQPILSKYQLYKLTPQIDTKTIKFTDDQLYNDPVNKTKRKIYYQIEFTPQQKFEIQKVKKAIEKQPFAKVFQDQLLLSHHNNTQYNLKKTIQRLRLAYNFFSVQTPITNTTIDFMKKGAVYTFGHDKNFHPIIYFRLDRCDFVEVTDFINVLYVNLYICQRYRMIPHYAEKLILFFDLDHQSLTQIPIYKLYQSLEKINTVYCIHIDYIFIVNGQKIGFIWHILKRLLPPHGAKIVKFIQKYEQIFQFIHPSQLETRYRGSNTNLEDFWPPTNPKLLQQIPKMNIETKDEHTQYQSIMNHEIDFTTNQQVTKCQCNCTTF